MGSYSQSKGFETFLLKECPRFLCCEVVPHPVENISFGHNSTASYLNNVLFVAEVLFTVGLNKPKFAVFQNTINTASEI